MTKMETTATKPEKHYWQRLYHKSHKINMELIDDINKLKSEIRKLKKRLID